MRKRVIASVSLTALLFLLSGCPMGTQCPLGPKAQYPMDQRLLGTWVNDTLPEARKVTIYAGNALGAYELRIDELGPLYLLDEQNFETWVTTIGQMNFIVLRFPGAAFDGLSFYAYHYYFKKQVLMVHEFNMEVFEFESVGAYRSAVAAAMLRKDFLGPPCRWTRSQ
jgi:hypothetical protein